MHYKVSTLAATWLLLSVAIAPNALATEEQNANLPAIMVTEVSSRSLKDAVTATGTIRAVDEILVQPQLEGLAIDKINVDIGDTVKAGDILLELSKDSLLLQKSQFEANRAKALAGIAQYEAQVLEATANFNDAEQQKNRAEKLSRSGTGSVAQVERATAAFEIANARLAAAKQAVTVAQSDLKVIDAQLADVELRLSRTDVKAPVSGVISQRNAKIGAIASANANPLFTMIKDAELELVADISETDVQKVKVGMGAKVSLAGSRDTIDATVRIVAPTVNTSTRLAAVHLTIAPDSPARAGMFGTAIITVKETEALSLPLSAVTEQRGSAHTRLVDNGVIKQVEIKTGIKDQGFVEIIEGLNAGDQVVEKAGAFVRDGDRIRPVLAKSSAVN